MVAFDAMFSTDVLIVAPVLCFICECESVHVHSKCDSLLTCIVYTYFCIHVGLQDCLLPAISVK